MKNDRLANAVVYLLRGCPDAGLTKLLKLIYFADYHHYRDHLSTITGSDYVALERGPVMDNYKEKLESLEARGILSTREVKVFGHELPKKEYLPLMEPNTDLFSESELATLEEVVRKYGSLTGVALSNLTHEEALPWSFTWDADNPGRPIPLALFRWTDNLADEEDIREAQHRLAAAGIGS